MSTDEKLIFDVNEDTGVALLTLNRPGRYNAFDREMTTLWREHLERVEKDKNIKALVITGRGKAFCAGGDIDELKSFLSMNALEKKDYLWDNVHHIPLSLERIDCPTIAAINGTARGAGLDMALMCDLRVMDADTVVAESYINMGLMPGDGGGWFLPRLVGTAKALEILWTGDAIDAETAEKIGLVNSIAPAGEALAKAMALAERIARQPTQAIRFTKRSVYQNMSGGTLRGYLDSISSHMAVLEDLPEFSEKVDAFTARKK